MYYNYRAECFEALKPFGQIGLKPFGATRRLLLVALHLACGGREHLQAALLSATIALPLTCGLEGRGIVADTAHAVIFVLALVRVGKKAENYFVAGRSLNLFVVTATLGSQCIDSGTALGSLDLGYLYHCTL